MSDRNDKIYRNLVLLLKMFKNRPNHLAKFLLDNNSFNKRFLDKILQSNKLNDIDQKEIDKIIENFDNEAFFDLSQMLEHYQSLIINERGGQKQTEQTEQEINNKLNKILLEERYEDAVKIRDYMIKHNIKKL